MLKRCLRSLDTAFPFCKGGADSLSGPRTPPPSASPTPGAAQRPPLHPGCRPPQPTPMLLSLPANQRPSKCLPQERSSSGPCSASPVTAGVLSSPAGWRLAGITELCHLGPREHPPGSRRGGGSGGSRRETGFQKSTDLENVTER